MGPKSGVDVTSVESTISQVTVFASGARVRRVVMVPGLAPGVVRFVGLPLSVIDDTVRVELDGAATVVNVRTGSEVPARVAEPEQSTEVRAARRRVAVAETEIERITSALASLAETSIVQADPADAAPAPWTEVVTARRILTTMRAERDLKLRHEQASARRELTEASRELELAVDRDRRTGSAHAAKLHELRKYVELELVAQSPGDLTIHLEYQIAAARWAPSYVARLDGADVQFELRAVVAQDSGEDWTAVALRLSTAEPDRFSQLPELVAQKIGRRQLDLVRRGFRAPPIGADALYADHDRGFPSDARSQVFTATAVLDDSTFEGVIPPGMMPPEGASTDDALRFGQQNWDEDSSEARAFEPVGTPPPQMMQLIAKKGRGGAPAGRATMPAAAPAKLERRAKALLDEPAQAAPSQPPTPRLDYGSLRMAPATSPDRGKLIPVSQVSLDLEIAARVMRANARIAELVLPRGCSNDWVHTYDYAFVADGKVDVRGDRAWHSIVLASRPGKAQISHVAVPREQSDVFRVARIDNPFDGPLLPGPIDVYDGGHFLVTSDVDYTPPRAPINIGLGVDAQIKIARNVEFHEEAIGMLRGGLKLVHAITISVENLSPRPIDIEVRERVPVTREGDEDIDVTAGKVDPAWERWTPDPTAPRDMRLRGGYRWVLVIPATSNKLLRAAYEIKIAGKHELVGGNRRES